MEFTTKAGERHRGRRWCADCALGWRVAAQHDVARAAVFMRDQGVCHDCGLDCTSYEVDGEPRFGTYRVQINRARALEWCERILNKVRHTKQALYVIDLGDWHVDHAMPLHLNDREKPEAWREWTLPNLRTRCPVCHGEKTAQEAKDRGKVRRLNGTTKKKPGRKIPQRANPWPKKPQWDADLPPVEVDKPQHVEAERFGPLSSSPALNDGIAWAVELARRDRIQAAHQNPPQRKPKPRGWGR